MSTFPTDTVIDRGGPVTFSRQQLREITETEEERRKRLQEEEAGIPVAIGDSAPPPPAVEPPPPKPAVPTEEELSPAGKAILDSQRQRRKDKRKDVLMERRLAGETLNHKETAELNDFATDISPQKSLAMQNASISAQMSAGIIGGFIATQEQFSEAWAILFRSMGMDEFAYNTLEHGRGMRQSFVEGDYDFRTPPLGPLGRIGGGGGGVYGTLGGLSEEGSGLVTVGEFASMILPSALGATSKLVQITRKWGTKVSLAYLTMQAFGGGVGDYRAKIIADGGDPDDWKALSYGVGMGVSEFIFERWGFKRAEAFSANLTQNFGDALLSGNMRKSYSIFQKMFKLGVGEFGEESFTQMMVNWIAGHGFGLAEAIDEGRPFFEGVAQAGLMGFAGGQVIGASMMSVSFNLRSMRSRQFRNQIANGNIPSQEAYREKALAAARNIMKVNDLLPTDAEVQASGSLGAHIEAVSRIIEDANDGERDLTDDELAHYVGVRAQLIDAQKMQDVAANAANPNPEVQNNLPAPAIAQPTQAIGKQSSVRDKQAMIDEVNAMAQEEGSVDFFATLVEKADAALEAVAKALRESGVEVIFFKSDPNAKGENVQGFVDRQRFGRRIFINVNGDVEHMATRTMSHEFVHILEETRAYVEFVESVRANDPSGLREAGLRAAHARGKVGAAADAFLATDAGQREAAAVYVETRAVERGFWDIMVGRRPSVAQRFVAKIDAVLASLGNAKSKVRTTEIKLMRDLANAALAERGTTASSGPVAGTQFSVVTSRSATPEMQDGRRVVNHKQGPLNGWEITALEAWGGATNIKANIGELFDQWRTDILSVIEDDSAEGGFARWWMDTASAGVDMTGAKLHVPKANSFEAKVAVATEDGLGVEVVWADTGEAPTAHAQRDTPFPRIILPLLLADDVELFTEIWAHEVSHWLQQQDFYEEWNERTLTLDGPLVELMGRNYYLDNFTDVYTMAELSPPQRAHYERWARTTEGQKEAMATYIGTIAGDGELGLTWWHQLLDQDIQSAEDVYNKSRVFEGKQGLTGNRALAQQERMQNMQRLLVTALDAHDLKAEDGPDGKTQFSITRSPSNDDIVAKWGEGNINEVSFLLTDGRMVFRVNDERFLTHWTIVAEFGYDDMETGGLADIRNFIRDTGAVRIMNFKSERHHSSEMSVQIGAPITDEQRKLLLMMSIGKDTVSYEIYGPDSDRIATASEFKLELVGQQALEMVEKMLGTTDELFSEQGVLELQDHDPDGLLSALWKRNAAELGTQFSISERGKKYTLMVAELEQTLGKVYSGPGGKGMAFKTVNTEGGAVLFDMRPRITGGEIDIHLDEIITQPASARRKGEARRVLKAVTAAADKVGASLELTAAPLTWKFIQGQGKVSIGGKKASAKALKKFYESEGFVFAEGANFAERQPQPVADTQFSINVADEDLARLLTQEQEEPDAVVTEDDEEAGITTEAGVALELPGERKTHVKVQHEPLRDMDEEMLAQSLGDKMHRGIDNQMNAARSHVKVGGFPEWSNDNEIMRRIQGRAKGVKSQLTKLARQDRPKQFRFAPPTIQKTRDRTNMINRLVDLTNHGVIGRMWYEDSGKHILQMFAGDKKAAEKFVQVIAIMSATNPLQNNWQMTVVAWLRNQSGIKNHGYTTEGLKYFIGKYSWQARATDALLNDGEIWKGRKTGSFYRNLMRAIDGEKGGVGDPTKFISTIDVWMMRSMGYGMDAPTTPQYGYAEDVIADVMKKLNKKLKPGEPQWEAHQVQAAIWTAMKGLTPTKAIREQEPQLINKYGLLEIPKGEPLTTQIDYAVISHLQTGIVTANTVPHSTIGVLPELRYAKPAVQAAFTAEVEGAFLDSDGFDILAKMLGLLQIGSNITGVGVYRTLLRTEFDITGSEMASKRQEARKEMKVRIDAVRSRVVAGKPLKQHGDVPVGTAVYDPQTGSIAKDFNTLAVGMKAGRMDDGGLVPTVAKREAKTDKHREADAKKVQKLKDLRARVVDGKVNRAGDFNRKGAVPVTLVPQQQATISESRDALIQIGKDFLAPSEQMPFLTRDTVADWIDAVRGAALAEKNGYANAADGMDYLWNHVQQVLTDSQVSVDARKLTNVYSAAKGLALRQPIVMWYRPFFKGTKAQSNGVSLEIGREMTYAEFDEVKRAVLKEFEGDVYPQPTVDGLHLVYTGDAGLRWAGNKQFQTRAMALLRSTLTEVDVDAKVRLFAADADAQRNDYQEQMNGENYRREISLAGRQDVQRAVDDVISPRIREIEAKYRADIDSGRLDITPEEGGLSSDLVPAAGPQFSIGGPDPVAIGDSAEDAAKANLRGRLAVPEPIEEDQSNVIRVRKANDTYNAIVEAGLAAAQTVPANRRNDPDEALAIIRQALQGASQEIKRWQHRVEAHALQIIKQAADPKTGEWIKKKLDNVVTNMRENAGDRAKRAADPLRVVLREASRKSKIHPELDPSELLKLHTSEEVDRKVEARRVRDFDRLKFKRDAQNVLDKERMSDREVRMRGQALADTIIQILPDKFRPAALIRKINSIKTEDQLKAAMAEVLVALNKVEKRDAKAALLQTVSSIKWNNMPAQFREDMQELVGAVNFRKVMNATKEKIQHLAAIIDLMPELMETFSPREREMLKNLSQKDVGDMSTEEMNTLTDAILTLKKAAKIHSKVLKNGNLMRIAVLEEAMVGELLGRVTGEMGDLPSGQSADKRASRNIVTLALKAETNLKPDTMAQFQSGQEGIFWQVFYKDLATAQRNWLKLHHRNMDVFTDAMKEHGLDGDENIRRMSRNAAGTYNRFQAALAKVRGEEPGVVGDTEAGIILDPVDGDTGIALSDGTRLPMTVMERMHLVAMLMDMDNYDLIVNKGAPVALAAGDTLHHLTRADVQKIRNSVPDGELSVITATVAHLNGAMKIEMRNWSRESKGRDITKTDTHVSRQRRRKDVAPSPNLEKLVNSTLDVIGLQKDRGKDTTSAVLIADWGMEYHRISWGSAALTEMSDAHHTAKTMLNRESIKKAINVTRQGKGNLRYWNTVLTNLAREATGQSDGGGMYSDVISGIVNNLTKALLAANPRVIMYQPASLLMANAEIPMKYLLGAAASSVMITLPQAVGVQDAATELDDEIRAGSAILRARFDASALSVMNETVYGHGQDPTGQRRRSKSDAMMIGIQWGDRLAIRGIWLAAKAQVEAEYSQLTAEQKVERTALIAENAVNRTQPVWGALHSSGLGNEARNNPLLKLLTMFMAQRNQNINILARSLIRFSEDPSQWQKSAKDMGLVIGGQTLFIAGIAAMWEALLGGLDFDDDDEKTMAGWNAARAIDTLVGNLYFGGAYSYVAKQVVRLDEYSFAPDSSPLAGTTENIFKAVAAITDYPNIGNERWWKGVEDAITNGAGLSGYGTWIAPYRMIARRWKNTTGSKSMLGSIVGAGDDDGGGGGGGGGFR